MRNYEDEIKDAVEGEDDQDPNSHFSRSEEE